MAKKGRLWLGCAGFDHPHWGEGVFYPKDLPPDRWLSYYAGEFNSVLLDHTFHRLPDEAVFREYARQTPAEFKFSVTGSKLITHIKTMSGVDKMVDQFMSRVMVLEDKLGPVLWKTPFDFKPDFRKLKPFIKGLEKYEGTSHAFLFENKTRLQDRVIKVIGDAGMTVASSALPETIEAARPAGFLYVLKDETEEGSGDAPADENLSLESRRAQSFVRKGEDVYVYFADHRHGPSRAPAFRGMLSCRKK